MPFPSGNISRLVVCRGRVRVQALRDVCEERERAARCWMCEGDGLGLREGRGAGGVSLWHFDGGVEVYGGETGRVLVGRIRWENWGGVRFGYAIGELGMALVGVWRPKFGVGVR